MVDGATRGAARGGAHRMVAIYGDPAAGFLAPGGGVNVFVWGLVAALLRHGERVEIVAARYPAQRPDDLVPERAATAFGGAPLELGVAEMAKQWLADNLETVVANAAGSAAELARSRSVYTHYWLSGAFWSLMRAAHPACRAVRWVHSFHSLAAVRAQFVEEAGLDARTAWDERILGEADVIVVNSPAESEALETLYPVAARQVETVPGGCDVEQFVPGESRYLHTMGEVPEGRAIVLFLGRLEERKGYRTFLEVARELRDDARFSFLLVGGREGMAYEDAGRARVLEWLAEERLDNVRLLPAVSHDDLPEVYRSAMCIVLPSRYEPFGLTALEAQACGCVPIAADTGGLTATISGGETGFLLHPDPKEMAAAVVALADDPGELARLRANGLRWVRDNFSWDALAPRYARVLAPC